MTTTSETQTAREAAWEKYANDAFEILSGVESRSTHCGQPLCHAPSATELHAMPLAERLWREVKIGEPDECWLWTGYTVGGYGRMEVAGKQVYAHRAAWEVTYGWHPCVRGALGRPFVLHRCDNPPCCNPRHHFLGTQRANVLDMQQKGRASGGATRGASNKATKLTPTLVAEIRRQHAIGVTILRLSRELGIPRATLYAVIQRRNWRYLP